MTKYLLSFVFLLIFSFTAQGKMVDEIVAVVDGQVITSSELEEFLGSRGSRVVGGNRDGDDRKARRQALEQLIETKILLQKAKDENIEIREKMIDRRFEKVRGKFASEEEFRQALREENLTEAKLRKRIEEDLMMSVLIDREVRARVRVGGEELRQFYEKNKEMFKEPGEVELGHIFIKVRGGEFWGECEQRGKDILKRLREGADFSLVAKKYSDGPNAAKGGKLGFLMLGELSPEFEEAVSKLKVGEVSGLVKMGDGFHIIKLEGRRTARQMELPEVRDRIRALIFAKKAEKRYREWIDELKKNTYIEIK